MPLAQASATISTRISCDSLENSDLQLQELEYAGKADEPD